VDVFAQQKVKNTSSTLENLKHSYLNGIYFAKIRELKEHEKIDKIHLEKLKEEIKLDGILKIPIAVDKNTNIILDGHHRFHALKELKYSKIPVVFVDYRSPEIQVQGWRNEKVSKEDVINAGLSNKKLPPKTSKHMVKINNKLEHIKAIEKQINVPLKKLK